MNHDARPQDGAQSPGDAQPQDDAQPQGDVQPRDGARHKDGAKRKDGAKHKDGTKHKDGIKPKGGAKPAFVPVPDEVQATWPAPVDVDVTDRYRVSHMRRASEVVVVTFDHWDEGKSTFTPGTRGDRFYASRGWSQVHVATTRNDWYLGGATPQLFDTVRAMVRDGGYRKVVTSGFSMGGYAALLFAGPLGARRAVAVSPQFALDPAQVPWETRWQADRQGLDWTADALAHGGAQDCDARIVYDPCHPADARHVALMRRHFPRWTYVALPHAEHPALRPFAETGRVGKVIAGLIDGSFGLQKVTRMYRRERRESPTYWATLALQGARRPRLVAGALDAFLALPTRPPALLAKVALAACRSGDLARGVPLLAEGLAGLGAAAPAWMQAELDAARQALVDTPAG